jgi:hypothetical protein
MSVEDFMETDYLRIMMYGQSGSGKTTFWTTFPKPILAVIVSGGKKPGELKSVPIEYRKEIDAVVLHDSSEFKTLIDSVKENHNYNTIVLDHVSGLQDLVLKEVLGLDEIPVQKSWGLATREQYGQCTMQCKEYLRALLSLETHSVIIGQERENELPEGMEGSGMDGLHPTVGVALSPSLAGWLNPACDYILRMYRRNKTKLVTTKIKGKEVKVRKKMPGVDYCAYCEPHEVFTTKFRVPKGFKLPDVIVDPSYDKIVSVLKGEFKG